MVQTKKPKPNVKAKVKAVESKPKLTACQRTITIQQYTGTCWMNALLMCVFYSNGMHRVCRSYRHTWAKRATESTDPHKTKRVFDIFSEILQKLQKHKNRVDRLRIYERFSVLRPEHILETLHQLDKTHFYFNPVVKEGHTPYQYMDVLLSFLGVNVAYMWNGRKDFRCSDLGRMIDCVALTIPQLGTTSTPVEQTIIVAGEEFVLDACALASTLDVCAVAHAICGITCGGKRYVYNGYMRAEANDQGTPFNEDAAPCELIPYDWDTETESFCLNTKMCKMDKEVPYGAACFNFSKGSRMFIYVNKKHLQNKLYVQPKEMVMKRAPSTKLKLSPDLSANCVREKSNWSVKHPRTSMFDSTKTRSQNDDEDDARVRIFKSSPKMLKLAEHISDLDARDKKRDGTYYKHVIFTESKMSAKIIATALDYEMLYDKKHKITQKPITPYFRQVLLTTGSVHGEPLSVNARKRMLSTYNDRSVNVHGESVRFIILDGGFKEGIDLLDVKYVHIFEPPLRHSDRQQIIGRATRFCGQAGLAFKANEGGWPLEVFVYDVSIPEMVRDRKVAAGTMHELVAKIRDAKGDDHMESLSATIEKIVMESSVDYKNNLAVHKNNQTGGTPIPFGPETTWATYDKLTNTCTDTVASSSGKFELTPSQHFMSSYFTPKSDIHGMLLWHSTGSGKTCTAIATASTSFESAGWTILWVTRSSLKKDMQKNMVTCRNTDSTNNSSSSWIPTMSYRQFTNFLQGKNELYKRLTKRNGKDDPLRKTLLIVDEAHLVINPGDLLPVERPDKRTLQKWLHNSYEKSGQESCKVMLMTATPITESPLNLVELINMVKDKDDVLTTVPSEFQNMYLSHAHGKFTAAGKRAFQKWIGPHVSYLNRMFDARQFAQPIVKTVLVPMTTRMQMVETKHDIVEKLKNTIGYYSRKKNMMNEYLKKGRLDGKLLKEKIASNTKLIIKRDKLEKRIAIAKTDATRLKLAMQLDSIKVVDDRELREAEIKNNDVILGIKFTLKNIVGDQKVELSKIKLQGKIMDTDISQERMLRIDCGL